MSGLDYEFPPELGPSPSWENSPFLNQSPQNLNIDRSIPQDASSNFWRSTGSPLTAAYPSSQFSMHSSSLSITPSPQGSRDAFFPHEVRGDRSWHPPPAPMRSMSLATPEELPPNYQARFLQQTTGRVPVTGEIAAHMLYAHAAQGTAASRTQSAADMNPHGQQGRIGQPARFIHPQWGGYPQQSAQMVESGVEGFSRDWYTGSPNLAQVREEDISPHQYQPASRSLHHQQNPG